MSLWRAALALVFFWIVLHGLKYIHHARGQAAVLPWKLSHLRRRFTSRFSRLHISLQHVHLQIQTTRCNSLHDRLISLLHVKRNGYLGLALSTFYSIGYYAAVVGSIVSTGLLFWTCWNLTKTLFISQGHIAIQNTTTLYKRSLSQASARPYNPAIIQPIIPGITVPLSDLPVLLCAVAASQIVHELGHAIAAAIEKIPIQSVGVSLTLIFPSASVAFATRFLDAASSRSRSIIISAGPFHNLIFWFLLYLFATLNLHQSLWKYTGYRDVTKLARVVMEVEHATPLEFLHPGTWITHVNDIALGSLEPSQDIWEVFEDNRQEQGGWCVDKGALSSSQACCSRDMTKFSPLICFNGSGTAGCLDPVPLLTTVNGATRCNIDSNCITTEVCVRPDGKEQLVRLTVTYRGKQDVILWSGPIGEIEQTITLGTLEPRFFLFPVSLPLLAGKFFSYLSLSSLSLYFFNLLPLLPLDGYHLLKLLSQEEVQETASSAEFDIEASSTRPQRSSRNWIWRKLPLEWIPNVTLGGLVICSVLLLIHMR